ncbi:MAG: cupin domain-containing protein [Acidobacteria bacterium]|nr:MAG: cupin domain-containing protein [Acidobacteriota bacterium]
MKNVAMIPLLLGSTRIPDKNTILVDGYPLAFYVAKACKASGAFDEVYINSEHDIAKTFADMLGVKFYRRDPARGGSACQMKNKSRDCQGARCQTHDHFLADFMMSVPCDYLALVHTTSPLLKPETMAAFMKTLAGEGYDALFSAEERYTEAFLDGQPLNVSMARKIPTQTLKPVQLITWALTGWKTQSFLESFKRDLPDEKGPTFCGKYGLYPLDRIEALDADNWEDLRLIEGALRYRRSQVVAGAHRFPATTHSIQSNLKELMKEDGVTKFESESANARLVNIEDIKRKMGAAPWLYLLIYSGDDQTGLICQPPGEGAQKHCHTTHDEWWVVLEGEFEWRLEGSVVKAGKHDVVYLPRGTVHSIVCTSPEPGIRLACGARDMEHIYVR